MFNIKNNNISLNIENIGGEITSLIFKNKERIFNGDERFWKYHAPLLFPIVGRLKDDEYIYNNNVYSLPQHGFARIIEFSPISQSDDSIELSLQWNDDTLKKYPFKFILKIKYTLIENRLKVNYTVENVDSIPIIFGIGAHPAFTFGKNAHIEIENKSNISLIDINQDGLLSRKTKNLTLENSNINVNSINKTALIFKNDNINIVKLISDDGEIHMNIEDFPFFALWRQENAPFICLEPWFSHADYLDTNKFFNEKENMISLNPNKIFNCSFSLTFL